MIQEEIVFQPEGILPEEQKSARGEVEEVEEAGVEEMIGRDGEDQDQIIDLEANQNNDQHEQLSFGNLNNDIVVAAEDAEQPVGGENDANAEVSVESINLDVHDTLESDANIPMPYPPEANHFFERQQSQPDESRPQRPQQPQLIAHSQPRSHDLLPEVVESNSILLVNRTPVGVNNALVVEVDFDENASVLSDDQPQNQVGNQLSNLEAFM